MAIIPSGSKSYQARNPHLFPTSDAVQIEEKIVAPAPKRIRQNSKPLMNGLEKAFHLHLTLREGFLPENIHVQAVKFKLANGLTYLPDFFSFVDKIAWEVKGKWVDGDSFPKLKMAASVYPEISWRLAWKIEGCWNEQIILP